MSTRAERYQFYGVRLKGRPCKMKPPGTGHKMPPPPKERPMSDHKKNGSAGLALLLGSL